MEDPRILPCKKHISCMECLEADFRKLNTLECPVCKYELSSVLCASMRLILLGSFFIVLYLVVYMENPIDINHRVKSIIS